MSKPSFSTIRHTPGPWHRNIKPASRYPVVFAGRNTHVAQVATRGLSDDEIEANCDLITAAPDLLAEVKRLVLDYVNLLETGRDRIIALGGSCDPVDVMEAGSPALRRAKALIAKAEGGQ